MPLSPLLIRCLNQHFWPHFPSALAQSGLSFHHGFGRPSLILQERLRQSEARVLIGLFLLQPKVGVLDLLVEATPERSVRFPSRVT